MFPLKAQAASPPSMMQAGSFRVHLWRYAMPCMPAFYDFLVSLVSLPDPATTCLCCGELYANRNRVLLLQRQGARPQGPHSSMSLMDSVGSGDDAKNLRPSELSFQQFTEILEWWPQRAWTIEIHLKASRLEHQCVWHQAYLGWVERPSNCWKLFDSTHGYRGPSIVCLWCCRNTSALETILAVLFAWIKATAKVERQDCHFPSQVWQLQKSAQMLPTMQSTVWFRSNDDLTSEEEEEEEDGTFAGNWDCTGNKAMTYRNGGTSMEIGTCKKDVYFVVIL